MSDAAIYAKLAKPALDLGTYLKTARPADLTPLLNEAKARLDRFEHEAMEAGADLNSTAAARYGLLVILDGKGRTNPNIPLKRWSAGVHGTLFEGRDVSLTGLKDLHRKAVEAGRDFKAIGTFLQHCIDAAEADQDHVAVPKRGISAKQFLGISMGLVAICVSAFLWHSNTISQKALSALEKPYQAVIGQASNSATELDARLDTLLEATLEFETRHQGSLTERLPMANPSGKATKLYKDALRITLPRLMNQTLQRSLANEESPIRIYGSLRAMSILEQKSDWSSGFLAGWADQNDKFTKGFSGLSDHIAMMDPLPNFKATIDTDTLEIAREIAREAPLEERAFLELTRLEIIQNLPKISLTDQIPGLDQIVVRRSNQPLATPLKGLNTKAGWILTRDQAAMRAIETATQESSAILGDTSQPQLNPAAILKLLQIDTNANWRTLLDDLRVRPFDDQTNSIRISGALGAPHNPLTSLFTLLWDQVGGNDRSRAHQNQLAIAISFGPLIQYVEQGKMAELSQLFSGLNVALAALNPDDQISSRRLLDVNAKARSISALTTAPTFVAQIVEDVLTQAAGATSEALRNPEQLAWENGLLSACQATLAGYPFTNNDDTSLSAFIDLFGPRGALEQFEQSQLNRLLDRSEAIWRWKPEPLFRGFNRETATFFQTAATLREGFFHGNSLDTSLVITSLGQSGSTTLSLGGRTAQISNDAPPVRFNWPGDTPAQGMEVTFAGADSIKSAGPWGMMRILDNLRLRSRDDGKRYRVDFKSESGRLFVDMEFESLLNPVSLRPLFKDLVCPPKL